MISLFKNLGEWVENDAYTPSAGDVIFYDWQDSGSGDNTGGSDHVGIVEKVSGATITVIEGNYSDSVKRRTIQVNGRYIRGYGVPKYNDSANTASSTSKKAAANTTADPKTVWNYLLGKIGNAFGVAGLMGNLYAESGLVPNNLQNTYNTKLGMTDAEYTAAVDNGSYNNFVKDSAGYGLAQWTYYTRKQALKNYADSQGASIGNLEMQLGFLYKELSEGYSAVLTTLKKATSVLEASNAVLTQFEKPANQGTTVQSTRASYGQKYYDTYAGTSASASSGTSSTETSSTTSGNTHTVVKGDTLSALAKKYGTTVSAIVSANKSKYSNITASYIVVGWVLTIPTSDSNSSSSGSTAATTKKTATDAAASYLKSLAGTYVTTAKLNCRNGAGTSKSVLVVIPKGTEVKNYGYYTTASGVKWLYIQFTYKGVVYTGFASSTYLSKQ
jgi:LysM repeat protein